MAKTNTKKFAIGVDYGTNSVRALVVDTANGAEIAAHVYKYRAGEAGVLSDPRDPNVARQSPRDYIQGLHTAVRRAVQAAQRTRGFRADRVVGIGVDTTGSTPIPVDRAGTPLGLSDRFASNLAAQAWLWKDHTAHAEAAEITEKAERNRDRYLTKCGGAYSSEWYWSKILHCRRTAPAVFKAAYGWVELADFIPGYLTGNTAPESLPRGICAAGHKAMYSDSWRGLPSAKFLASLHPDLPQLRERFAAPAVTADQLAGQLDPQVAKKVGLPAGVAVAVGAIDAHMGAVGAGIRTGTLVKILGTSSCDMMVAPLSDDLPDIPGLCGIVPGSILPGMYGLEAGQSAVGDIYNWFVNQLAPAEFTRRGDPHANLTRVATTLVPGESGILALDWNNGNRSVLTDPLLSGMLVGQTLHTTAPEVYRALIESTAFGALSIINRFEEYGVHVKEVVNCGGIAEKNPFVMQIYADVCQRPMKVSRSAETCGLGAAIFGAVVGGAYRRVDQAQRKMTGVKQKVYRPNARHARTYQQLYALYQQLHDAFGTPHHRDGLGTVMKQLIALRNQVRKA